MRVSSCVKSAGVLLMVLGTHAGAAQSLPVVPGGEGFGMSTRAAYGCGSAPAILRVTNLNDSGAGSLRDALERSGPRVVIFEISGTILLRSDIAITEPCVTVAGQTAPSPGITIRNGGLSVYTHDVLIQHLRIRPGDGIRATDCYAGQCGVRIPQTVSHDGVLLYKVNSAATVNNIVLDHLSISWAGGKNANNLPYDAGITYWRCIISEALYRASNVIVGGNEPSSLGMLLGGHNRGISIIGNLFAHNSDRGPEIHENSVVHFVNNVVYDWGKDENPYPWASFVYAGTSAGDSPIQANIVGNKYIAGPPPSPHTPLIAIGTWSADTGSRVYLQDNAVDAARQAVTQYMNYMSFDPRVGSPAVAMTGITVRPSSEVESFVLANAGARPLDRDPVDRRIVSDVQNRAGSLISSQDQVGGWPSLAVTVRALSVPANPHAVRPSGYTVLEEWLHSHAAQLGGAGTSDLRPLAPTRLRVAD